LAPNWATDLESLPADRPMILIANELLDCLPARQLVRTDRGWAERMVGLDQAGELAFGLAPCDSPAATLDVPPGAVIELSEPQTAFASALAQHLAHRGGAALLIDYGRDRPGFGDTFQALQRHQKVDPLSHPGQADLTVHADFPAVIAAARAAGVSTGILTQGEFLRRLGIEARAEALSHGEQAGVISRQLARLIEPDQMGDLFKAACLYAGDGPPPPGFEDAHD
jgi:SAM-dependent MidA family methyltransferase